GPVDLVKLNIHRTPLAKYLCLARVWSRAPVGPNPDVLARAAVFEVFYLEVQ
ncbi:Hypothetical predicted protein, partial [Pelobates cultripes]